MVENMAMTGEPLSLTYSSAVSRYSACLKFLIAGINDLYIMACDIRNEYFNAPFQEKICFAAGPEHKPLKTGNVMVMVRYLYGLKSSGAACIIMFT